jgi:hypothetical protein
MTHRDADESAEIARLIMEMERDGVPLSPAAVLREVEHPNWAAAVSARDWRAHVPRSVRRVWDSLPLASRLCVFETAELTALDMDAGATMVSGPAARRWSR